MPNKENVGDSAFASIGKHQKKVFFPVDNQPIRCLEVWLDLNFKYERGQMCFVSILISSFCPTVVSGPQILLYLDCRHAVRLPSEAKGLF